MKQPAPTPVVPYNEYEATMTWDLGQTISNFLLHELLGEGAVGRVYRAEHMGTGQIVALKVLRSEHLADRQVVRRFIDEALATGHAQHDHIVRIHEIIEDEVSGLSMVMELLEGRTLRNLLNETKTVPVRKTMHIAHQVASALAAAHMVGVVHRDLKPANIFLDRRATPKEFVKLLDFGVAKLAGGARPKEGGLGQAIGSPAYMSPEQASGDPINHRTDIYSLGVTVYEMLTGVQPFASNSFVGTLRKHLYLHPSPPSTLGRVEPRPDIPEALETLVMACLEKDPAHRPQTMKDLARQIGRLAKPPPALRRLRERLRLTRAP